MSQSIHWSNGIKWLQNRFWIKAKVAFVLLSKEDNYVLYSVHNPFLKYLAQQNLNIFVVVYLRRRQLRKEKPGSSRLFRHVVKKAESAALLRPWCTLPHPSPPLSSFPPAAACLRLLFICFFFFSALCGKKRYKCRWTHLWLASSPLPPSPPQAELV